MANVKFGSSSKCTESVIEFLADYSEQEQTKTYGQITIVLGDVTQASKDFNLPGDIVDVEEGEVETQVIICAPLSTVQQLEQLDEIVSITAIALAEVPEVSFDIADAGLLVGEDEEILPDLDTANWMEKLNKDEIIDVDGKPCPKLSGLRRLAKPYIESEYAVVNKIDVVQRQVKRTLKRWGADENGKAVLVGAEEVIGTDYFPYASVTFTITLSDGRTFTDSADAYLGNCNEFGNYPTAVASARAEGRTLRKVLGIAEHVYEELSSKDAIEELTSAEDSPIAAEQKRAIETVLNKLEGVTLREVLEKVSADATNLDELTSAQAVKAIKFLNEKKKSKKKR